MLQEIKISENYQLIKRPALDQFEIATHITLKPQNK